MFYNSFEVILCIAVDWLNYLMNRSTNNAAKVAERLLMTIEQVIIYIWLNQTEGQGHTQLGLQLIIIFIID